VKDRSDYRLRSGAFSPEQLVFIDESHVDLRTTFRSNGWAYKGQRATVPANFIRGKRYELVNSIIGTY
jgi:hypothetical protein